MLCAYNVCVKTAVNTLGRPSTGCKRLVWSWHSRRWWRQLASCVHGGLKWKNAGVGFYFTTIFSISILYIYCYTVDRIIVWTLLFFSPIWRVCGLWSSWALEHSWAVSSNSVDLIKLQLALFRERKGLASLALFCWVIFVPTTHLFAYQSQSVLA